MCIITITILDANYATPSLSLSSITQTLTSLYFVIKLSNTLPLHLNAINVQLTPLLFFLFEENLIASFRYFPTNFSPYTAVLQPHDQTMRLPSGGYYLPVERNFLLLLIYLEIALETFPLEIKH